MGNVLPCCTKSALDEISPEKADGRVKKLGATHGIHLIINLDVNKTVIMSDTTGGKSLEVILAEEISSAAWGREVDSAWRLFFPKISTLRPQQPQGEEQYLSYTEWLGSHFPGDENKKTRTRLRKEFFMVGQPGEGISLEAECVKQRMVWKNGEKVILLPAFFELLRYLKTNRRSFTICFRTFGEDLTLVASALNPFCQGQHPAYRGEVMDGSDGDPDYRLHMSDPTSHGTFFRETGNMALIMGTVEQSGEGKYKHVKETCLSFYRQWPELEVIVGNANVSNFLHTRCFSPGTLGIRDHYHYWKSVGMKSEGGKPFFFESGRPKSWHSVFFDDNIRDDELYIVDPRRLNPNATSATESLNKLRKSHICKVEPLDAMSNENYFIERLEALENGYRRRTKAFARLQSLFRAVIWLRRLEICASTSPDVAWTRMPSLKANPMMKPDKSSDCCMMSRTNTFFEKPEESEAKIF